MALRRILWLLIWIASLIFVIFYQQWLAWLLLAGVLLVPVFSFVISLPAMVTARLEASPPERVTVGTAVTLRLQCKSKLVPPLWSCRIRVTHAMTGKKYRLRQGDLLPTDRCGGVYCNILRPRVYDCLGLFALPVRGERRYRILVDPQPLPLPDEGEADADMVFSWKPKPGGFSENHELRLYAPGDSLRQIHWKLSAKTGKLIIREPMIPNPGKVLVRFALQGSAPELQRLLGRCLWLGNRLLEQHVPFELECHSGAGPQRFCVGTVTEFQQTMDQILTLPLARNITMPELAEVLDRYYEIGGAPDEKD